MNFGERVHLMRRRRKMTQTELGKAVGVSKTTIFRIESGEFSEASQQIAKMARALNVSADYLLGLREEPEPLEPESVEKAGEGEVSPSR
jgi:transcriptional regulator with XRE-family HTH domain